MPVVAWSCYPAPSEFEKSLPISTFAAYKAGTTRPYCKDHQEEGKYNSLFPKPILLICLVWQIGELPSDISKSPLF